MCERNIETSIGCVSHTPTRGPGPQPRHALWPGIKLATLQFTSQWSIHWAHQPGLFFLFLSDMNSYAVWVLVLCKLWLFSPKVLILYMLWLFCPEYNLRRNWQYVADLNFGYILCWTEVLNFDEVKIPVFPLWLLWFILFKKVLTTSDWKVFCILANISLVVFVYYNIILEYIFLSFAFFPKWSSSQIPDYFNDCLYLYLWLTLCSQHLALIGIQ